LRIIFSIRRPQCVIRNDERMSLSHQLEAILFAGARSFSLKRLADVTSSASADVEAALAELSERLEQTSLMVQRAGNDVQLVTKPEYATTVQQVVKDELHGELTRPALEALTILAYRGPLTRPELEQIRGVHSSMILRNLMLRGLVEEKEDTRLGQPTYAVTLDFLRHIGVASAEELPSYEDLRGHQHVVDILNDLQEKSGEKGEGASEGSNNEEGKNTIVV